MHERSKCMWQTTPYANRSLSDKETTHMFLSHLNEDRFKHAINTCEMAILNDTTVTPIYLIPAFAGTIDQLAPGVSQHVPVPDTVQSHGQRDSRIQQLTDYCKDKTATSSSFCDYVSIP